MARESKSAVFRRVAPYCLLAATLAAMLATEASAQTMTVTAPGGAIKPTAEVAASYSFKPEFNEGEDAGRGKSYSLSVGGVLKDKVSTSLTGIVQTTDAPEEQGGSYTEVLDPRLGISFLKNPLAGTNYKLRPSVRFLFGASDASREEGYYGSARGGLTLSRTLGLVTGSLGGTYTKHFRRYTLSSAGTPNVSYTTAGRAAVDLSLPLDLSLGASYELRKSTKYEGNPSYSYENVVGLDHATTDHLTLSVSIATTDAQLDAGGRENNGLDVYRPNQTSLDLGASYAL
jgi:hypothetical protein